jgi:hypothetical protein
MATKSGKPPIGGRPGMSRIDREAQASKGGKVSQKERLDGIEKELDELRHRFDLYFQGSKEQRMPPTDKQAQMGGELRRMREDEIKLWNTIDKFRFSQIFARFVALDRLWARTMKQIEDGTYKRDRLKVRLRKEAEAEQEQQQQQQKMPQDTQVGNRPASIEGLDVDVNSFEDGDPMHSQSGQKPVGGKQVPRPVPAPVAGAGGGGAMNDQSIKRLYDVYMQAKKRTGENSSLTMEALKKQIEKQIPQIKAKHKCDNVEFKVVLKDGKAMLKAVPK